MWLYHRSRCRTISVRFQSHLSTRPPAAHGMSTTDRRTEVAIRFQGVGSGHRTGHLWLSAALCDALRNPKTVALQLTWRILRDSRNWKTRRVEQSGSAWGELGVESSNDSIGLVLLIGSTDALTSTFPWRRRRPRLRLRARQSILFDDWCTAHDKPVLPASSELLARFLSAHSAGTATQRRRISVIDTVHHCYRFPAPGRNDNIRTALDARRAAGATSPPAPVK